MELLLCPNCGGFVRRDWENCRACGSELTDIVETIPQAAEPENPEVDAAEQASAETAEPTSSSSEHDEDASNPDVAEAVATTESESGSGPADAPAPATPVDLAAAANAWAAAEEPPASEEFEPPSITVNDEAVNEESTNGGEPLAIEENVSLESSEKSLLPPKKTLAVVAVAVLAIASVVAMQAFKPAEPKVETATSTTVAAPALDWVRFVDPGKRLAVDVPTPPVVREEVIDGKPSLFVQSDVPGPRFRMTARVTTAPQPWSKEDKILTDARERHLVSIGQTSKTSSINRVNDVRQLNATFEGSNNQRATYRAWVNGPHLYELSLTTYDGKSDPALFTRFADSLLAPVP